MNALESLEKLQEKNVLWEKGMIKESNFSIKERKGASLAQWVNCKTQEVFFKQMPDYLIT
jgi:hypothetical protein